MSRSDCGLKPTNHTSLLQKLSQGERTQFNRYVDPTADSGIHIYGAPKGSMCQIRPVDVRQQIMVWFYCSAESELLLSLFIFVHGILMIIVDQALIHQR